MFADDVLQRPCGGRRSIVAIVTDTALARALLASLGLNDLRLSYPKQIDRARPRNQQCGLDLDSYEQ